VTEAAQSFNQFSCLKLGVTTDIFGASSIFLTLYARFAR
jgi:hypothetical protein